MTVPWSGGSLRLVVPDMKYAGASLEWVSQPEVVRWMGGDFSNVSLEGERQRLREMLHDTSAYHWEIELDGRVVGNVHLDEFDETSREFGARSAVLSYIIGYPALWGRGIASAAAKALLDWARDTAGIEIIKARILPQNQASIAVVRKLGFELYGLEEYLGPDLPDPAEWNTYRLRLSRG